MRVLCLDQYSELGGAQRSLLDLLPAFRDAGWNPLVAAPPGMLTEIAAQQGYGVHTLHVGRYTLIEKTAVDVLRYAVVWPGLLLAVATLAKRNEIGLIYVNGPRLLPAAAVMSRLLRIQLVFHCHNRLLQRTATELSGRALQLAGAHVIACCRFALEPLTPYLRPERISIHFNGVADMGEDRPTRQLGAVRRIGVIGRIEEQKGHLEFVRAAKIVSNDFPNCQFVVVGAPLFSGALFYERVVRESEGLNFEFQDWTENISLVLRSLDVLVVPSKAVEATTRVILEAFSARVPVVAFPSGGIREVLHDDVNGFCAAEISVDALARRIMDVLSMSEHSLLTVRARARRSWEESFTLAGYRENVCGVIEGMLRTSSSAPAASARSGLVRSATE